VLVLLAPGQGAQSPGMLTPWLDLPGARGQLEAWSDLVGLDLLHLGTTGSAEEVRDTAVTQPLLAAAALLTGRALDPDVGAVLGHSIGEIAALALADVISDDDAVRLAAARGRAMAEASALAPTGMAAVLGGDEAEVRETGRGLGLEVATVNVAGQLVLGGPVAALEQLAATPPAGARVRRLEVAGAFHTQAMAPAAERLAELVAGLTPRAPRCLVVANADGAVVDDGRAALDRLVGQLTGPVRFDLCLQRLADLGATVLIELAPGGTLAGLAKRALPGVDVVALKTADDLTAAPQTAVSA
jgi:[acyl-carrier-protein] S-malonyltransferase